MSLSCLLCQPSERSDLDFEYDQPHNSPGFSCRCYPGKDRNWSGNLTPPPYAPLRRTGSIQPRRKCAGGKIQHHRKLGGAGGLLAGGEGDAGKTDEPRLVRSGGMRRDWSFEDLRAQAKAARKAAGAGRPDRQR